MNLEKDNAPEGRVSARSAALIALTAAVYFVTAKLGLNLAFVAEQVTVVWPPTGIALAALFMIGPQVWPGVMLGAFLANVTTNEPLATAAGIAIGNTLEAVVAARMLRRFGFRPALDRMRDVLLLLSCGAGASTMISATIGVASLCAGGVEPWFRFGSLWWIWWIGDALGDLVMAPILLVWSVRDSGPRRIPEAAALLGATLLASLVVFAGRPAIGLDRYPLYYMMFPLLIWAALRLGQSGTSLVIFTASAVAIASTANGLGPFAMESLHESLVVLQLFMGVVAATGLFLGAAIAERDATRARRAADFAALELSEGRLRLALDAGRLGVWDWNIPTGAVDWSENLEPMHGLPPGGFAGTFEAFVALVHPDDRARASEAIGRTLEGEAGYDIELRIVWPDGSVHWVAAKGSVLRDASGKPVRMLGTTQDVSQRRHLEENLREHARQLADADRRKDEFLAMLAHELRNPLAPLTTSLHLLGLDDAPRREELLAIAERQVKHLTRLVDDLLDVSRISRGKVTLRKAPVPLADIVASALEVTRPLLDKRDLTLTLSLPREPVVLEADSVRLTQVLSNLLNNAAKYTPVGGSIWITGERGGEEVVLSVRDTGAGLTPELLPYIFDLFVQGDAPHDRAPGGLGIGLTLVRWLVELHGGRVEARSSGTGHGSEFVVHLPVQTFTAPASAPTRIGRLGGIHTRTLRILIVEDNQDTAEMLGAMLEMSGHEVELAADGMAALDAAKSFHPMIVISDLGLPGIDGYELAGRLREQPGIGRVVLVALSGYGRDEDKQRARAAGFDHYLVKPADVEKILEIVATIATHDDDAPRRTLTGGVG